MPNESQISRAARGKEFGLTPIEKQAISFAVSGYSVRSVITKRGSISTQFNVYKATVNLDAQLVMTLRIVKRAL